MSKKESTKRRYFDVGIQIEELLHSGVFKAGERLPSERDLSERFETSRATIREAIIMLELKGLVAVRQGAGIYFIDSPDKVDAGKYISKSDIGPFEFLQARQVIESNVVAFAASQIKFNEIKALKSVLHKQEAAINEESSDLGELYREFYQLIAESTQNRVLILQAFEMWSAVPSSNPLWKALNDRCLHEESLRVKWVDDHKRIFAALQKRSSDDARAAVWQHIEHSKQELMKIANATTEEVDLDDFFFASEVDVEA